MKKKKSRKFSSVAIVVGEINFKIQYPNCRIYIFSSMECGSIKYSFQKYSLTHYEYKRIEEDIDLLIIIDFNPWNVANLDPLIVFKFGANMNHQLFQLGEALHGFLGGQMHQVGAIHKIQLLKRRNIAQPLWQIYQIYFYPQNFKGNEILNLVQESIRPLKLETLEGELNGGSRRRRQKAPILQIFTASG